MQILIIILVASLFAFEEEALREWFSMGWEVDWPNWVRLLVTLGGFAVLIGGAFLCQWRARLRVERKGDGRAVIFSERATSWALGAIVVWHVAMLAFLDWLGLVREWAGNLVLVDEIIALAPALVSILAVWAAQYPISRLVREASLMRQLDSGLPVYPVWKRGQFVLLQVRLHFVLILLPILLVIGWRELIEKLAAGDGPVSEMLSSEGAELLALAVGTAGIFLLAPLMIRFFWDTQPLPAGEIRDRLLEMCQTHRVRIRELLVWNTFGVMMNGAVMGVVGQMRYILLTDALLDAMGPREIESVMAHELGHVRRRHLPALILALFAILITVSFVVSLPMSYLLPAAGEPSTLTSLESSAYTNGETDPMSWIEVAGFGVSVFAILFLFGWVSRRFERQADTFAVQHLSGMTRTKKDVELTADAVGAMAGALGMVASLNHIPTKRRSWRHGSIAWRQRYLRSLVGRPSQRLGIDRMVFGIKLLSLLIVTGMFSFLLWEGLLSSA